MSRRIVDSEVSKRSASSETEAVVAAHEVDDDLPTLLCEHGHSRFEG